MLSPMREAAPWWRRLTWSAFQDGSHPSKGRGRLQGPGLGAPLAASPSSAPDPQDLAGRGGRARECLAALSSATRGLADTSLRAGRNLAGITVALRCSETRISNRRCKNDEAEQAAGRWK